MSEHKISHKESDGRGTFYIASQGSTEQHQAALMYHYWGDDKSKVNVDHTEVNESLRGQDVGLSMLRELADWARKQNLGVSATCPFAVTMFKRYKEEFADVQVAYTA